MDVHRLGASGVSLSAIGLGGVPLGNDPSSTSQVSRATAAPEAAAEAGTNWVDSSENYFDTGNEALLGAALRDVRGATGPPYEAGHGWIRFGFSRNWGGNL